MYSSTITTKGMSIFCLCVLESLTLDKSKWYFLEMKIQKFTLLQMLMFIDIVIL